MSNLTRALLGGAAGGFQAVGEIADANIKSKEDSKKAAAIEKRKRNLENLRAENQAKAATTAYERGSQSGYLDPETNLPISKYDLQGMDEEGKASLLSGKQYKEDELTKKQTREDEKAAALLKGQKELAHIRGGYQTTPRPGKDPKDTVTDKKWRRDQDLERISAYLPGVGGSLDRDTNTITMDLDGEHDPKKVLEAVRKSGFPNAQMSQETVGEKWFGDGPKAEVVTITLGPHSDKPQQSTGTERKASETGSDGVGDTGDSGVSFDTLYNKVTIENRKAQLDEKGGIPPQEGGLINPVHTQAPPRRISGAILSEDELRNLGRQ